MLDRPIAVPLVGEVDEARRVLAKSSISFLRSSSTSKWGALHSCARGYPQGRTWAQGGRRDARGRHLCARGRPSPITPLVSESETPADSTPEASRSMAKPRMGSATLIRLTW